MYGGFPGFGLTSNSTSKSGVLQVLGSLRGGAGSIVSENTVIFKPPKLSGPLTCNVFKRRNYIYTYE